MNLHAFVTSADLKRNVLLTRRARQPVPIAKSEDFLKMVANIKFVPLPVNRTLVNRTSLISSVSAYFRRMARSFLSLIPGPRLPERLAALPRVYSSSEHALMRCSWCISFAVPHHIFLYFTCL